MSDQQVITGENNNQLATRTNNNKLALNNRNRGLEDLMARVKATLDNQERTLGHGDLEKVDIDGKAVHIDCLVNFVIGTDAYADATKHNCEIPEAILDKSGSNVVINIEKLAENLDISVLYEVIKRTATISTSGQLDKLGHAEQDKIYRRLANVTNLAQRKLFDVMDKKEIFNDSYKQAAYDLSLIYLYYVRLITDVGRNVENLGRVYGDLQSKIKANIAQLEHITKLDKAKTSMPSDDYQELIKRLEEHIRRLDKSKEEMDKANNMLSGTLDSNIQYASEYVQNIIRNKFPNNRPNTVI